jgi:hypothetical protein
VPGLTLSRTPRTVLGVLVARVRCTAGRRGSCPWSGMVGRCRPSPDRVPKGASADRHGRSLRASRGAARTVACANTVRPIYSYRPGPPRSRSWRAWWPSIPAGPAACRWETGRAGAGTAYGGRVRSAHVSGPPTGRCRGPVQQCSGPSGHLPRATRGDISRQPQHCLVLDRDALHPGTSRHPGRPWRHRRRRNRPRYPTRPHRT